jgi:hypothetical protein
MSTRCLNPSMSIALCIGELYKWLSTNGVSFAKRKDIMFCIAMGLADSHLSPEPQKRRELKVYSDPDCTRQDLA